MRGDIRGWIIETMKQGWGNGSEQKLRRLGGWMGILIELRRKCFSMLVASKRNLRRSKGNMKRIKRNTEYDGSKGNKAFTGQAIWRNTSYTRSPESSWHGAVTEQQQLHTHCTAQHCRLSQIPQEQKERRWRERLNLKTSASGRETDGACSTVLLPSTISTIDGCNNTETNKKSSYTCRHLPGVWLMMFVLCLYSI